MHISVRKSMAWAVLVSFLISDLSFADTSVLKRDFPAEFRERIEALQRKPEGLIISSSAASVTDAYRGASEKLVIHIQDAHTNLGAQKNLAKILDEIIQQYGVDLVFVEGGTGNDSLSFLRGYAGSGVRKRVAMRFLEKGEISGEEYLDIVSEMPFTLWGIEDPSLYEKSLVTYARVIEVRKAALAYLDRLTRAVDAVKPRIYSAEFFGFEKAAVDFRKTRLTFTDYFERLRAESGKNGIDFAGFENLVRLESVRELESRVDFRKADAQQAEIVRRLSKSEPLFAGLAQAADRLKLGRTPVQAFYDTLEARMGDAGLPLELYPEFDAYLRYLRGFSAIDIRALLDDIERIEGEVFARYAGDPDSVRLREITRYVDLLRNYFSLKLKPSEFQTYKKNIKDFRIASWLAYLNRKLIEFGRHAEAVPLDNVLDDRQGQVEAFYRTVEARDHAFVDRAFSKMEESKRPVAVLICGGYHTPHLKELMREKDASYVVVTPFVTEETDMQNYERVLLGSLDPTKRWMVSAREGTVRPVRAFEKLDTVPSLQGRLFRNDGLYGKTVAYAVEFLKSVRGATPERFRFLFDEIDSTGEIQLTFSNGSRLGLNPSALSKAKFARDLPSIKPFVEPAKQTDGPGLPAAVQQKIQEPESAAAGPAAAATVPEFSGTDAPGWEEARAFVPDFVAAVEPELGPGRKTFVIELKDRTLRIDVAKAADDGTVTANLFDAAAEEEVLLAAPLVLTRKQAAEHRGNFQRQQTRIRTTMLASTSPAAEKAAAAQKILMNARMGRTDYLSRSGMIAEALKPMKIDTRQPVLVKIPAGALSSLLKVNNGRFYDGFMKLFIGEAIHARRQTYGINVYYGLDTADPAVRARLDLLLRELKAENADNEDYVREIGVLENEIADPSFLPADIRVVELFDAAAGAAGKGNVNLPLDLKVAEYESGKDDVGMLAFRGIIQVGIYAARTNLSAVPDALLNAYQTLLGRTLSAEERGMFAAVITGDIDDLSVIARFAIPPTVRINIDAIFELFNLMLRQLAKSA